MIKSDQVIIFLLAIIDLGYLNVFIFPKKVRVVKHSALSRSLHRFLYYLFRVFKVFILHIVVGQLITPVTFYCDVWLLEILRVIRDKLALLQLWKVILTLLSFLVLIRNLFILAELCLFWIRQVLVGFLLYDRFLQLWIMHGRMNFACIFHLNDTQHDILLDILPLVFKLSTLTFVCQHELVKLYFKGLVNH